MKRLPWSEIKRVREMLRKTNDNKCEICLRVFTIKDDIVLDHCHMTGRIRGGVHRSCNAAEGLVRKHAARAHKGVTATMFIILLGRYLEKYGRNPRNIIHPNY